MTPSRRHLVLRLSALTLGLMTPLVVGELVLRYVYPVGGLVYRLDPTHLQEYIPGSSKIFFHLRANGGRRIRVSINDRGFRGEPLEIDGRPRVIVYGDSFVAAEFSELPATFTEQLEARLQGAEVINAGVVGAGPDQSVLRMRRELPLLEPGLVILAVFAGNDFGDLVRNELFGLSSRGDLVRREARIGSGLAERFSGGPLQRFAVARMVQKVVDGVPRRIEALLGRRGEGTAAGPAPGFHELHLGFARSEFALRDDGEIPHVFYDGYDADLALEPSSPSARYKRALMRAVLGEASAIARQSSAALLVVAIPAAHDLIEGYDGVTVDRDRFPERDPRRLTNEVVEAARLHGIAVVDLFDAFEAAGPEDLYFSGGDEHWNDRGQELAARVVASELQALDLVPR